MNLQSPAYMTGALTTKPPRQLSRLGTNPGVERQSIATKPDKRVNSNTCVSVIDENVLSLLTQGSQLCDFSRNGDVVGVVSLILSGADVNAVDEV